ASSENGRTKRIGASEIATESRVDIVGPASTGHFALALAHGHHRGVSVFTGVDSVFTGAQNRKRLVGSIDLEDLIATQPHHANVESPFRQFNLSSVVIQIEKGHARHVAQAYGRRPKMHLDSR